MEYEYVLLFLFVFGFGSMFVSRFVETLLKSIRMKHSILCFLLEGSPSAALAMRTSPLPRIPEMITKEFYKKTLLLTPNSSPPPNFRQSRKDEWNFQIKLSPAFRNS